MGSGDWITELLRGRSARMRMLALIPVLALSACGFTRTYTRYGDADPGADRNVLKQWSETQTATDGVRVLIDTVPEGISAGEAGLSVLPGYGHMIIGKFSSRARNHLPQTESLIEEARRLAGILGGDLVIGSYLFPYESQAQGISGVVIKSDPKLGGAKALKTTPMPQSTTSDKI